MRDGSPAVDVPGAADRLELVDALRGFALLGVFWANLHIFSGIEYMGDAQRASFFTRADTLAFGVERFFVENKFMGLFSFLFGISFWLFLSRVSARGGPATRLFYRRVFWLFAIGCVHGWLLWCFDILRFYALWAVLLPLFVRTPPRRLLAYGLTAAVLVPALVAGVRSFLAIGAPAPDSAIEAATLAAFASGGYGEMLAANWRYDWHLTFGIGQIGYQVAVFGRLLLGLLAARTLELGNPEAHRPLLRRVLMFGGLLGLAGSTTFAFGLLAARPGGVLRAVVRRLFVEGGQLALTLAYASAIALLFLAPRARLAIRRLAPLGRMALTMYLCQTLFGLWMFYGFAPGPHLMGKVGPALLAAVAVAGYLVQIALAKAWLSRFRFGPAEWVWRSLTYGRIQPLAGAGEVRAGAA
jgi:uncharacterized protein